MSTYQTNLFQENNAHHLFLELALPAVSGPIPGGELLARPTPRVYTTVACSQRVLDNIDHRLTPDELRPFTEINSSDNRSAPSTQADLFVWIQSNQRDEVFATGMAWLRAYADIARLAREEHGFMFRDSRDLTGFVDGSANPKEDHRLDAALISKGVHQGGSFVLTQRWVHDLVKFHSLPVSEQEAVIGRTKKDSVEFDATRMPVDAHVARTDIKRDNQPIKIYRRSVPVGRLTNAGLYFLAFSAQLDRFTWLLESMYGNVSDGISDKLLEYSRPISGSFYFAPNVSALERIFT